MLTPITRTITSPWKSGGYAVSIICACMRPATIAIFFRWGVRQPELNRVITLRFLIPPAAERFNERGEPVLSPSPRSLCCGLHLVVVLVHPACMVAKPPPIRIGPLKRSIWPRSNLSSISSSTYAAETRISTVLKKFLCRLGKVSAAFSFLSLDHLQEALIVILSFPDVHSIESWAVLSEIKR